MDKKCGGGPKRETTPDIADMMFGLNVKAKSRTSKRVVKRPAMRTSARVQELETLDLLARMGMGETPRKPVTYVPALPTPRPADSMANLEKKKAKQLHELLLQMMKKLQYIKNEEVVAKIRADAQVVYDMFNARYESEIQDLHKLKMDIEQKRAQLMEGGAKKKKKHI